MVWFYKFVINGLSYLITLCNYFLLLMVIIDFWKILLEVIVRNFGFRVFNVFTVKR